MIRKVPPYGRWMLILVLTSFLVRLILTMLLELGNDEVYYWTYALYPDLSHFDHPPMVGWIIQLFTLNLAFDQEVFIRFGPLFFGTINTFLVYLVGRALRDEKTGWYAALLYTSSIYSFIIAGTFILPDTPQLFYWLISLYFLFEAFNKNRPERSRNGQMVMAGIAIGLAMLSKYTSVFLWIGTCFYILVHERRWLRSKFLYISIAISMVLFLPVIIWNIRNNFISFTFHSGRVGFFESGININTFLTEITGQIFYNNPVNFVLIILALVAVFRGKLTTSKAVTYPLFYISLPLIILFLFISLFRPTLPHWTGPAYTGLILIAAYYIAEIGNKSRWLRTLPVAAVILLALITILGAIQIQTGVLYTGREEDPRLRGKDDVTLDMYGWEQIGDHFKILRQQNIQRGWMSDQSPIITYRWFPAAHLDYYVARPVGINVLALGNLEQVHKYAWINHYRGGFRVSMNAWFITTSRDYADVYELYGDYFEQILPSDTLAVVRSGKVAEYAFYYRLMDMKKLPEQPY